jgi:hypothetical protein
MVWLRGWKKSSSPMLLECCLMLVCIDVFGWKSIRRLLLDKQVTLHSTW